MNKEIVSTEAAPKAIGPYSQGVSVKAEELVFFSGQIAIDPQTAKLVGGDAVCQTKQILKNIDGLLKSRGLTAKNVVKTTVFLTDIGSFSAVNAVYAEFFSSEPPARSCVGVAALPAGALVEIEIIAAK